MKHLRISQPLTTPVTELHQIGYVHSTQGLKGDLFIVLKSTDDAWLDDWDTLILAPRTDDSKAKSASALTASPLSSQFLEFSIASWRTHKKQGKDGLIVRLEDLSTCTDVEPLVAHTVWIPKVFLESDEGENIFLAEIEGFTVVDENLGAIGPIVAFSSNGAQDLIEVEYNGNTFYIPLVKAFIKSIDRKSKKLHMAIPDGLLE